MPTWTTTGQTCSSTPSSIRSVITFLTNARFFWSRTMKDWRTVETRLATLTLVALAIFVPFETYASYVFAESGARFLIHPGYLHSVAGMLLLFVGARHS